MTWKAKVAGANEPTSSKYVAPLLPTTAVAPEPARRVNFFKALVLYWLLPGRYGPHLAVASIWRGLAAHGIAILSACAAAVVPVLIERSEGQAGLYAMRVVVAQYAMELAHRSTVASWPRAIAVASVIPISQVVVLILATVAMPWCGGGDSAGSVWRRSVKNAYWSTTIVIPIAVVIAAVRIAWQAGWWDEESDLGETTLLALILAAVIVPIVLFVRMLIVGAGRYVGEPAGPAFGPREPRCDDCGYLIVHLPIETSCPECGLPVRDSLPGGRRQPTGWQRNERRARAVLELLRTQWLVLRGTDFFRQLPVHEGLAAARHFWWATFLLVELMVLGLLKLREVIGITDWDVPVMGMAALAAAVIPFALQAAMTFAAAHWAQLYYGIRDYRISAIVCYYAAPLMWPVILVLLLGTLLLMEPTKSSLAFSFRVPIVGLSLDGVELVVLLMLLLAMVALVFWWLRVCTALRVVRYANV